MGDSELCQSESVSIPQYLGVTYKVILFGMHVQWVLPPETGILEKLQHSFVTSPCHIPQSE